MAVRVSGPYLILPAALRASAGLKGPTVVLAGCGRYFEMMDRKAYEGNRRRMAMALRRLSRSLL